MYGDHRDLHVLTHAFPTRRSSDLGLVDRWFARVDGNRDGRVDAAELTADAAQLFARFDADRDGHVTPLEIGAARKALDVRSEEHTSELQSLMRISYAVFCLKKKKTKNYKHRLHTT